MLVRGQALLVLANTTLAPAITYNGKHAYWNETNPASYSTWADNLEC